MCHRIRDTTDLKPRKPMFTFAEYNTAAARTEKYTVTDWRQQIPVNVYRALHGVLGLSSELAEIIPAISYLGQSRNVDADRTNLDEELGDLWWYAALLYRVTYGLAPRSGEVELFANKNHPFARDAALIELRQLAILVGEGADLCKRTLYYGKPLDIAALKDREIITSLQRLTMFCGADLDEVWKINIAKLWVRFPGEFSGELAINRDTLTELAVMVEKRKELKAQKEAAAKPIFPHT